MFFITFCLLFLLLLTASEDSSNLNCCTASVSSLVTSDSTSGQGKVKVKPKQDVTLQCWGPRDASVVLLEWIRPDLKSDGYVLAYRNGLPHENNQLPSFRGRVALRDPEMKFGDFSLVLKRANNGDTGTYVCRVVIIMRGETTYTEVRHLIDLKVQQPGDSADSDSAGSSPAGGFMFTLFTVLFLVLLIGGLPALLICGKSKKHKRTQRSQRHSPSVDDDNFGDVGD